MKRTILIAIMFIGLFPFVNYNLLTAQNFEWAKRIGGGNHDEGLSIALDASGNVYTVGFFQGTVDFDPGTGTYNLTSAGDADIFISKLDPSGNYVWAKQMGGTSHDEGVSIAIDASGYVYTTGVFWGTADFNPGAGTYELTSFAGPDIFISKLDASGNFVWARQIGGISTDVSTAIALDTSGNVYTTGYFWGTPDFDPGPGTYNLTSFGSLDVFISKLDAFGNFVWAKQLGGADFDYSQSIALDASGNVYTTGWFEGKGDYDPGAGTCNLTSAGDFDIFISKLDATGSFVWAKRMGGTSFEVGNSINIDTSGNVYTTGNFEGTADFDPGAGVYNLNASHKDIFISKLDASGDFIWAKRIGGSSDDTGISIDLDATGGVYYTGFFSNTVDFDPGTGTYNLSAMGDPDICISKLDASGNFLWACRLGGISFELGMSIAFDASGYVYTTGNFLDVVDFDPGSGIYNLTPLGDYDVFIHKLCTPVAPTNTTPAGNMIICAGNSTTLSASGAGVLGWYSASTGGTYLGGGSSFITPVLTSSKTFYVQDSTCLASSRTAIAVIVIPNLPVMVSIEASENYICEGTSVAYTATPVNGGSNPSYQWQVNGTNAGTNSSTYTYAPANEDAVTVIMTSSEVCTTGNPATSNIIIMTVNPLLPVSANISASANNVCDGTSVTFTATPVNGGSSPSYEWYVNGTNTGNYSTTYTYEPANNDEVSLRLTSSEVCTTGNPATSNVITMTVNPLLPVSANISASANNVCEGTPVTFTVTPVNGGSNPSYQWQVNGTNAGANSSTYTYEPANDDAVTVILTSDEFCTTANPVTSNILTIEIIPVPAKPNFAVSNDTLISNAPAGNQWYLENILVTGAIEQRYIASESGNYSVTVTLNGCSSEMSNPVYVTINGIGDSETDQNATIFPNPTTGEFNVNIPSMKNGEFTMKVVNNTGVILISSKYTFAGFETKYPVDISQLANGTYTLLIQQHNKTITRKLVLNK
jgi:hypothetical protein